MPDVHPLLVVAAVTVALITVRWMRRRPAEDPVHAWVLVLACGDWVRTGRERDTTARRVQCPECGRSRRVTDVYRHCEWAAAEPASGHARRRSRSRRAS